MNPATMNPATMNPVTMMTRSLSIAAWRAKFAEPTAGWLTATERCELEHWHPPRRREAWLAGRQLAKTLLNAMVQDARTQPDAWRGWEVLSLDPRGRSCRPRVRTPSGERWSGSLSISHTDDVVLVTACASANRQVGCDVHEDQALGATFQQLWFNDLERRMVTEHPAVCTPGRIWAAKEAFYKAGNHHQPFAPRQWQVRWRGNDWGCRFQGRVVDGRCSVQPLLIDQKTYFAAVARVAGIATTNPPTLTKMEYTDD